jgi:hypothetical protein
MKKLLIVLLPFLSVAQIDNVALQEEFGKLLNEYRISKGKTPVTFNADAKGAAKIQADYLASTVHKDSSGKLVGKVGHIHPDPNLRGPQERVLAVNPEYDSLFANNILSVCENAAAIGSGELTTKQLAAKVLDMWMKSPRHNEALLDNYGINLEFGIYASTTFTELPYYEYEADPATMSSKPVLKYHTLPKYSIALVFITKIVW